MTQNRIFAFLGSFVFEMKIVCYFVVVFLEPFLFEFPAPPPPPCAYSGCKKTALLRFLVKKIFKNYL